MTKTAGKDAGDSQTGEPPLDKGHTIKLFGRRMRLPGSVILRRILGIALIAGGILGFLPVLGFWMIPLGLLVLSRDSAIVRRWRRKLELRMGRKRRNPRNNSR